MIQTVDKHQEILLLTNKIIKNEFIGNKTKKHIHIFDFIKFMVKSMLKIMVFLAWNKKKIFKKLSSQTQRAYNQSFYPGNR